jgi:CheY-like chemotaxis protein
MNTPLETNEPDDKWRILIIDNNRQFTHSAHSILQHAAQYVVCDINDPRRALEAARSFKPDLVLVDLFMPQEDGIDVAVELEADRALRDVAIVFMTALITREEASDGRRVNGHRLVAKPRSSSDLLRIVEENLPCCAEV